MADRASFFEYQHAGQNHSCGYQRRQDTIGSRYSASRWARQVMKLVLLDPSEFEGGASSEQSVALVCASASQFRSIEDFCKASDGLSDLFSSDAPLPLKSTDSDSLEWAHEVERVVFCGLGMELHANALFFVIASDWNFKEALVKQPGGPYIRYAWETTA